MVEIHSVVFEFDRPVVLHSILDTGAEQQSGGRVRSATRIPVFVVVVARIAVIEAGPGTAHFAVHQKAIEGVAEARSERGRPVEVLTARRDIRLGTKHPWARPIKIVPNLSAAQKAAVVVADRTEADMAAGVEPGPGIECAKLRTARSRSIGCIDRDGRRYQRRRNKTHLQARIRIHVVSPPNEYSLKRRQGTN